MSFQNLSPSELSSLAPREPSPRATQKRSSGPPRPEKSQNPKSETTSQRPHIETLLEHYRDVLEGIPDREHRASDDLLALMCPAWNSPAYQQLEHLLRVLHERWPRLRQALRVRYERYSEVRVAYCRKCGNHPSSNVGNVHRHPPGRSVALKPRVVRVLAPGIDWDAHEEALAWLERHWHGLAVVPPAVAQIEAERRLREAA